MYRFSSILPVNSKFGNDKVFFFLCEEEEHQRNTTTMTRMKTTYAYTIFLSALFMGATTGYDETVEYGGTFGL